MPAEFIDYCTKRRYVFNITTGLAEFKDFWGEFPAKAAKPVHYCRILLDSACDLSLIHIQIKVNNYNLKSIM